MELSKSQPNRRTILEGSATAMTDAALGNLSSLLIIMSLDSTVSDYIQNWISRFEAIGLDGQKALKNLLNPPQTTTAKRINPLSVLAHHKNALNQQAPHLRFEDFLSELETQLEIKLPNIVNQ